MTASCKEIDSLDMEKDCIVQELFVDTADDNYVTARWCFSQRLYIDFYWLSVHAIEKYLKAVLLLNGASAKGYGHKIAKLYAEVERVAGDLLPPSLPKPVQLPKLFWRDETAAKFVGRLYRYGNEHNRYNLFGYAKFGEDLYKLDTMIFRVRRLCHSLDKYYLPDRCRAGKEDKFTCRQFLLQEEKYWDEVAGGRLSDIVGGRRGKYLKFIALNHNLAFAPDNFSHGRMPNSKAAYNPVLLRHLHSPLEGGRTENARLTAEDVCDWFLRNVCVPKYVEEELRDALKKSRSSGKSKATPP